MRVVKTDGQKQLNEENLIHLLQLKADGPTVKEFHANHRGKRVSLWYKGQNRRIPQQQKKAYKKR